MKRILLVDASPRKNGNSEIIVDMLASDLNNEDVTVFKMRENKKHKCVCRKMI